ncbi:hypothetical protein [Streptomyces sp. enrichment culture]|uniref:hypothetical protein n=1 Tax=Streptomyces sp. enrichment culture TaxID=1795815 RepID=UPI003F552987
MAPARQQSPAGKDWAAIEAYLRDRGAARCLIRAARSWSTYGAFSSCRPNAEPVGGPLPDITAWRDEGVDGGLPLSTELVRWPGGRALYDPRPGEQRLPGPGVSCRFYHSGDTP